MEGQLKSWLAARKFNDREDGNRGLQKYGLNLNVATMEPSLRYQAIQSGDNQYGRGLLKLRYVGSSRAANWYSAASREELSWWKVC